MFYRYKLLLFLHQFFFFISSSPRTIKHDVFLIYYNPPDFSEKCCILSQEKMSRWAPLTMCSKFTCLQEALSPVPRKITDILASDKHRKCFQNISYSSNPSARLHAFSKPQYFRLTSHSRRPPGYLTWLHQHFVEGKQSADSGVSVNPLFKLSVSGPQPTPTPPSSSITPFKQNLKNMVG